MIIILTNTEASLIPALENTHLANQHSLMHPLTKIFHQSVTCGSVHHSSRPIHQHALGLGCLLGGEGGQRQRRCLTSRRAIQPGHTGMDMRECVSVCVCACDLCVWTMASGCLCICFPTLRLKKTATIKKFILPPHRLHRFVRLDIGVDTITLLFGGCAETGRREL